VDLHLSGKLVIIIGGGNQALKKIKALIPEKCSILILSDKIIPEIKKIIDEKQIKFQKIKIKDTKFLSQYEPFIIMSTTNDPNLEQKIIQYAKTKKILVFSSENSQNSDIANLSIISIKNSIQIAISTKGKSPIMAKKIKNELAPILEKSIKKEHIVQIKVQEMARELAKKHITTQKDRKTFLYAVNIDPDIKQLIKEGNLKNIRKRIETLLELK
jgi:precorrin-2 dehydrogenase/sirohydrochlorin ferrochelatase